MDSEESPYITYAKEHKPLVFGLTGLIILIIIIIIIIVTSVPVVSAFAGYQIPSDVVGDIKPPAFISNNPVYGPIYPADMIPK